jgi:hypothetical protein
MQKPYRMLCRSQRLTESVSDRHEDQYSWLIESVSLDVLFIGPYDLSIALGYPPPSPDPHPEVEKVIQNILKASHAAGKKWFVASTLPEELETNTVLYLVRFTVALGRKLPNARQKDSIWCVHLMLPRYPGAYCKQINATSDMGAMSEAIAAHLAAAVQ